MFDIWAALMIFFAKGLRQEYHDHRKKVGKEPKPDLFKDVKVQTKYYVPGHGAVIHDYKQYIEDGYHMTLKEQHEAALAGKYYREDGKIILP